MKFSRMLAVGAAAALVGVSTLAVGGSASAAETYVDAADLSATETSPYSPGWFQGNVSTAGGSFTSTPAGLDVTGAIQILNGDALALAPGTPVSSMAPGMTVASGDVSFQISVFTTGDAGFTTLYADAAGIASDQWYTSQAWGGFAAKTELQSLSTYEAAMEADSQLLAFGFNVVDGFAAEVVSISWNGNKYWFLPAAPTGTASPASATLNAFIKDGITMTFTGYVPGEDVILAGNSPEASGIIDTVTADANGTVVYVFSGMATSAIGLYDVTATGLTSNVQVTAEFTITANPAVLAATGADFTPAIATGGILMLLGAGFVMAGRRRSAAHRS